MYDDDAIPNVAPVRLNASASTAQPADEGAAGDATSEPVSAGTIELETRRNGCDIVPPTPEPKRLDGTDVKPCQPPVAADGDGNGAHEESLRENSSGCAFRLLCGAVCLVACLWLYSAVSPFLANALTLHGWRLWMSIGFAALPLVTVVFPVSYCLVRLSRLPRVEQFSEKAYSNKGQLRRDLAARYLGRFPDMDGYAAANGIDDDAHGEMRTRMDNSLKRLQGESDGFYSDSRGWLAEFKEFQALQDVRAQEIIGRTWKLVAMKTAASPWKIVDMIAVVYNSTVMVARLARLYNRRTSSRHAFRLVCRWFINIYIAGEMGDATQRAVEWADKNDLISSTLKPLARVVGKIAEGGANAFLVYRLGRRAMEYFRPLAVEK